jgi:hypothetical protein
MLGKDWTPLKCAEARCGCFKKFEDEVLSCRTETTLDSFTWKVYSDVQRGKFDQRTVVNVTYDGKEHSRQEFVTSALECLKLNMLHHWVVQWQAFVLTLQSERQPENSVSGTVDFISKLRQMGMTDVNCESFLATTLLAYRLRHTPRACKLQHVKPRFGAKADDKHAVKLQEHDAETDAVLQDQDVHMFLLEDDEQDALVHKTCFARVLQEYAGGGTPCTADAPTKPAPLHPRELPEAAKVAAKDAAAAVAGADCPDSAVDAFMAWLQSDRCSGQFWGAPNFSFIAAFHLFLEELTGATGGVMQHDTDASKHGKGVSDGDGSDFKGDAGRAELEGVRMEDTPALFNDMVPRRSLGCKYGVAGVDGAIPPPCKNDGSMPLHTVTRRKLHIVEAGTVRQRGKAVWKGGKGSRECHSARGCGDPYKILLRRFSCACWPCMRADFTKCETRELIGFYKDGKYNNDFVPKLLQHVSGAGVGQRSQRQKDAVKGFVNALGVGAFVAVNVEDGRDDEGHFYWLARITKAGYDAPVAHTNTDGVEFSKGDAVVDVQWYHRPNAAADGLLFKEENLATTTLHAGSIMLIEVGVVQRANGRVAVPQGCYDQLADWFNETH